MSPDDEAVLEIEGDSFGQSYTLHIRLTFIERVFLLLGLPYRASGINYIPREAYPQPKEEVIFLRLEIDFLPYRIAIKALHACFTVWYHIYGKRKITQPQAVDCD